LQDKVHRLNQIAIRFKQKTEQVEGALEYAKLRQQMESGVLRHSTMCKQHEIYGDKVRDSQTLTTIYGINRELKELEYMYKDPGIAKMIQTDGPDVKEVDTQKSLDMPGLEREIYARAMADFEHNY
jgi:hypothetical protein